MFDRLPALRAVDKRSKDKIVHPRRLCKADRPAHSAGDPRPPGDGRPRKALPGCLATGMVLRVPMTLVGPLAVSGKKRDAKRRHQSWKAETAPLLPPSGHRGADLPRVGIDGVPSPYRSPTLSWSP
jgi:hypothetical protein